MEYICPNCKKPVYDDEALLCLYCGESLRRGVGFLGSVKGRNRNLVVAAAVLLTLFSFLFLILKK